MLNFGQLHPIPTAQGFSLIPWDLHLHQFKFVYHNNTAQEALKHFYSRFSYIVAISFIGGGNRRTRRKPPTSCKSLTNVVSSTPQHEWESNSQH